MKQYKDLNLKKLREDCGLDFAHYTFLKGMCSCCYGPKNFPDRYWRKDAERTDSCEYLLFQNADNGIGQVTRNDTICVKSESQKLKNLMSLSDTYNVCIMWHFPMEKMEKVLKALRSQLDKDYLVIRPKDQYECIQIVLSN